MRPFTRRSALVLIIACLALGMLAEDLRARFANDFAQARCATAFDLLNPGVACGLSPILRKTGYSALRQRLTDDITRWKQEGSVSDVSIYFRDLDKGPTFGINEHVQFIPASLLKLPLLITILDYDAENPGTLERKVTYRSQRGETDPVQHFAPMGTISEGVPYTIEHLLEGMIERSDNKAYYALMGFLMNRAETSDLLKEEIEDLGIGVQVRGSDTKTVSVKSYATLFHQLYFSSALSNEASQKALTMLAKTDFTRGIVEGVPDGVRVAHKFGERTLSGELSQLHDCGIVYYAQNPYSLCIMTRGTDLDILAGVIRDISKAVYTEVDSRRITP